MGNFTFRLFPHNKNFVLNFKDIFRPKDELKLKFILGGRKPYNFE